MLLSPLLGNFNLNNNNVDLSHHHHHSLMHRQHHHNNGNSLGYQLTEQLLSTEPKCYSPRPGQRAKAPPHIKICPPDSADEHGVISSHYLHTDEELDNDVFQSPQPTTPSYSDEKHEVHSGRLYLIRHTGSSSGTSSPTSPSRSPSRGSSRPQPSAFSFRPSSPSSNQSCSAPNVSPSSPTLNNKKIPVFVRVYRCNNDHFAVISRDAVYTSKPVYVNMRHCRVLPGDCLGRFIVAGKCDSGNVIEFEAPELSSLEQWLDAFQTYTPPASPSRTMVGAGSGGGMSSNTPPIPRSPALPTLTETDEED